MESLRFLSDLNAVGGRKGRDGAEKTLILIQLSECRPWQWNEEVSCVLCFIYLFIFFASFVETKCVHVYGRPGRPGKSDAMGTFKQSCNYVVDFLYVSLARLGLC